MAKTSIMVVEDEAIVSMEIRMSLENMGYVVSSVVNSGGLAVQKAEQERPDIILMDIRLRGDMDGIEAAGLIHSRLHIPIIFLTAYADESVLTRARETEPFGYLLKPFHDRELRAAIEMAIYKAQMEEELLKARKFEAIATLAGGLAHDFNNLLSAILGCVDLARMDIDPEHPAARLLAEAEKNTLGARDLIKKFITLSKGGDPVKTMSSLQEVIEKSAHAVLNGSHERYTLLLPNDLRQVKIDPEQIKQVFENLLENAGEAMRPNGMITITVKNVAVKADSREGFPPIREGDYVKVEIKDQGKGISSEDLSKVFDPYFSTKERGARKGMGLGLAIVYSIVTKHGGYVHLESTLGAGATVHVYLPAINDSP